jgi:endoglucanase
MPTPAAWLSVQGNRIVAAAGQPVTLRGIGLGGWMNMENFITGFPANESAFRAVVQRALGRPQAEYFFERYLDNFFTAADAAFIKSLGFNLVRLPFNYRHFEDDQQPLVLRPAGLARLEQAVRLCAEQGLYTILDLHAAPGCQNQDWHSDNPSQQAGFWQHRHFQDRAVWLWQVLAEHFKDNPWVAGYDPLNEPADPSGELLAPFYRRVVAAIREIDPRHILFLEGNRYAQDFDRLSPPLPNAVYTLHDYPPPGFIDGGPYPGMSRGEYYDRGVARQKLVTACRFMLKHQTPIWIGEFGPVYTGDPARDAMRFQLLQDQLSFYRELGAHWCLWTYKDLGLQGLVSLSPDSAWVRRLRPLLDKKAALGVDSWGGRDTGLRHVLAPLEQTFAEYFPNYLPFPFDSQWQINRAVRHILLAEPLLEDLYALLAGLDAAEIDALLASFRFEHCGPRPELAAILRQANSGWAETPRYAEQAGAAPNA